MPQRTTITAVQTLLGDNYGPAENGTLPDLQQFVDTATVVIDRVQTDAVNKGIPMLDAELELIERWLSCHFYTKLDPLYTSKSTSGASGSFINSSTEPERYKEGAINLDYSGCLKAILARQFASMVWLGKPPSAQIPYEERS